MSDSRWELEFQGIVNYEKEQEVLRRHYPVIMASFDCCLASVVTYRPTESEFHEGEAEEHFYGRLEAVAQEHMLDPDQVHEALYMAEMLLPESQS